MLIKRFALVIGALAASAFALAPSTASGGQPVERRFHATYAGEYQPASDVTHECSAGQIANLVEGSGVATLIGRFDLRIEGCFDPATFVVTGTAYYTAANGDLLAFEFAGDAVPQPDGSIVSELPAASTFGTGRFAHVELVSGVGGAVDTSIGTSSTGVVDGLLIYDASDRSR